MANEKLGYRNTLMIARKDTKNEIKVSHYVCIGPQYLLVHVFAFVDGRTVSHYKKFNKGPNKLIKSSGSGWDRA